MSSACLVSSEAVASCAVSVVLLSFGSDLDADEAAALGASGHEAAAGERLPETLLRGLDEAGAGAREVVCSCRAATSSASWP